jgi:hypothetical protein
MQPLTEPTMNPQDPDKLEASIHRLLSKLPDRKAPSGLEARVLAELARRSALPWWKKSFAHWPSSIRAGFFIGAGLAAALVVAGVFVLRQSSGAHEVTAGISTSYAWFSVARDLVAAAGQRVKALAASVPPLYLYGGAAFLALCYAAVAAAGAATYRALLVGRVAQSTP